MADTEKNVLPETAPPVDNDVEIGSISAYPVKGRHPNLKHADTNNADEALQFFQAHAGDAVPMTPEEDRRLLRKIDWNLMPLLCVVYGLNYLDKTTVSYASVMGFKVCTCTLLLLSCLYLH